MSFEIFSISIFTKVSKYMLALLVALVSTPLTHSVTSALFRTSVASSLASLLNVFTYMLRHDLSMYPQLRVVDSVFPNLDTVEILHTSECHTSLQGRTVPCTRFNKYLLHGHFCSPVFYRRAELFPYSRPNVQPTDDTYPPFRPSYTIPSL